MGVGYIPLSASLVTTSLSGLGFGVSLVAIDRSFNRFEGLRNLAKADNSPSSVGSFASFLAVNACTPNSPTMSQPYSFSIFQQASIYQVVFRVRNMAPNIYNNDTTAAINVSISSGTAGVGDFDITCTPLNGSAGVATTVLAATNATFTGLGGLLTAQYRIRIEEENPDHLKPGQAATICFSEFDITLQTGATSSVVILSNVYSGQKLNTSYIFTNPVYDGVSFSNPVTMYNANV